MIKILKIFIKKYNNKMKLYKIHLIIEIFKQINLINNHYKKLNKIKKANLLKYKVIQI